METFDDIQAAVAFLASLRAHGIMPDQLDTLRENDLALRTVAAQIHQLTAPDPVSSAVTADARTWLYPGFSDKMPIKVRNALKREGITDVGCLQICTIADLLDIGGIGSKSIAGIQEYLERRGMRLREKDESRHDRMRYIYPDATMAPICHLPTSLALDDSIRTYGDLQRFTRSELIEHRRLQLEERRLQQEKLLAQYPDWNWPVDDSDPAPVDHELNIIEDELAYFGLSLAPE